MRENKAFVVGLGEVLWDWANILYLRHSGIWPIINTAFGHYSSIS